MTEYWNIPRVWSGDAFIYGGGTSLKDFPNEKLIDKRVVGCNDSYVLGADVIDYVCFGDRGWYLAHKDYLHTYGGLFITNNGRGDTVKSSSQVKICKRSNGELRDNDWELGWFQNTGVVAIELAIKLGAERLYLLGFDCKLDATKTTSNWYEDIRKVRESTPKIKSRVYEKFIKWFDRFEKERLKVFPDVEIINLNPDSAIETYPKKELSDVF